MYGINFLGFVLTWKPKIKKIAMSRFGLYALYFLWMIVLPSVSCYLHYFFTLLDPFIYCISRTSVSLIYVHQYLQYLVYIAYQCCPTSDCQHLRFSVTADFCVPYKLLYYCYYYYYYYYYYLHVRTFLASWSCLYCIDVCSRMKRILSHLALYCDEYLTASRYFCITELY